MQTVCSMSKHGILKSCKWASSKSPQLWTIANVKECYTRLCIYFKVQTSTPQSMISESGYSITKTDDHNGNAGADRAGGETSSVRVRNFADLKF